MKRTLLVLAMFIVAFFMATIIFDTLARLNGFYAPGLYDSKELEVEYAIR